VAVPDSGLADFSNVLLVAAIAFYAVAVVAYAFDFAFSRRKSAGATRAAVPPERVGTAALVGAAAVGDMSGHSFPADPSDPSELADLSGPGGGSGGRAAGDGQPGRGSMPTPALPSASASRWPDTSWLRAGFLITCTALTLHILAIATRGIAEHRVPWGNMFEFISAITCAAVVVLVIASVKFRAYFMGLFVLLPVVLALAVDVVAIYTPVGALVPALQSYWIAIHVTGMVIAIGTYIFGAVTTVLYLMVARHERRVASGEVSGGGVLSQLPGSAVLDRLAYRAILFAFPAWTFAVIAGAIWADHAWGRYWGWDPKETWSFIVWVVYAAFLHARATAGWRGKRAAYIQLVGFTCLMFNLIGVNLWITGLHSYAGLS
jgi:cytochrome c-type biogenesis protein CcsB